MAREHAFYRLSYGHYKGLLLVVVTLVLCENQKRTSKCHPPLTPNVSIKTLRHQFQRGWRLEITRVNTNFTFVDCISPAFNRIKVGVGRGGDPSRSELLGDPPEWAQQNWTARGGSRASDLRGQSIRAHYYKSAIYKGALL